MLLNNYILNEVEKHLEIEGHETDLILTNIGNMVTVNEASRFTLKEILDESIADYVELNK